MDEKRAFLMSTSTPKAVLRTCLGTFVRVLLVARIISLSTISELNNTNVRVAGR